MDKLTVGILGLGRGITHLRNFAQLPNAVVVGAADRIKARRHRAKAWLDENQVRGVKLVCEYEELLELQPDAVVIASNGKVQVKHACLALEAGCAVLSEVPGAYTQDEIEQLRSTVEHTGGYYMFGENTAFCDVFRYWRKWVVEDRFGPISLAEGEYVHYLPSTLQTPDGKRVRPTEARGRSDVKPAWRADQPPIQYLTHDLGPLLEVLDDRVVSVSCRSGPWWNPDTPLRSDGQIALFETEKGTLIRILVTLSTHRPAEHRYRLFGTHGGTEFFEYEGRCRRFDRHRTRSEGWEWLDITRNAPEMVAGSGHGGTDPYMAKVFIENLLAGRPSPIDVYRMAEYSLPGIVAAESARQGGAPLPVPNLRRGPFAGTILWDAFPQP